MDCNDGWRGNAIRMNWNSAGPVCLFPWIGLLSAHDHPYKEKISADFLRAKIRREAIHSPLHGENGNPRKSIKTHKIKALLRLPRYTT